MGAVTIIFLIPYLIIASIFGSIAGAVTGTDKAKVELPYDKEKGLVWEVDMDSTWFELAKTEVKDDKQVFTFRGKNFLTNNASDPTIFDYIPVNFIAENGEEKLYFAKRDDSRITLLHTVLIYSPDEYDMFTVTPKSGLPIKGGEWYRHTDMIDSLYKTEVVNGEKTFTLIYVPQKDGRTEFEEVFKYETDIRGDYDQYLTYKVVFENGKATIKGEVREYFVRGEWTETKPEIK